MNDMRLFNVIGIDDLEGMVFARCTTIEKAQNAKELTEAKITSEERRTTRKIDKYFWKRNFETAKRSTITAAKAKIGAAV